MGRLFRAVLASVLRRLFPLALIALTLGAAVWLPSASTAETRPVSDEHLSRHYGLPSFDQVYEFVGSFFKQQVFVPFALTIDTGSVDWDLDDAQVATLSLDGNATLENPTNIEHGGMYTLIVTQDGGGNTLSFGTAYKFGDAGAPSLSTTDTKRDVIMFLGIGGTEMLLVGLSTGY